MDLTLLHKRQRIVYFLENDESLRCHRLDRPVRQLVARSGRRAVLPSGPADHRDQRATALRTPRTEISALDHPGGAFAALAGGRFGSGPEQVQKTDRVPGLRRAREPRRAAAVPGAGWLGFAVAAAGLAVETKLPGGDACSAVAQRFCASMGTRAGGGSQDWLTLRAAGWLAQLASSSSRTSGVSSDARDRRSWDLPVGPCLFTPTPLMFTIRVNLPTRSKKMREVVIAAVELAARSATGVQLLGRSLAPGLKP